MKLTQQTTRPLAIRKDSTWYAYGWDLTKNVTEIFGKAGYLRTAYTYTPYGEATATGDVTQPLTWSSEYTDDELALICYNYRHYNPTDGRWINRDPIEEQGGANLYAFVRNNSINVYDMQGFSMIPTHTPITSITVKRKNIKWLAILGGHVLKATEIPPEKDIYGHWWIEFDNESYGWWPVDNVTAWETIIGVAGQLNGMKDHLNETQDYHHGDVADEEFHPMLYVGNFWNTYMQYGKGKGKKYLCVKEEEIKDCLRSFARSYSGAWSYPWGQNCHSFQNKMMNMCCIRKPRY